MDILQETIIKMGIKNVFMVIRDLIRTQNQDLLIDLITIITEIIIIEITIIETIIITEIIIEGTNKIMVENLIEETIDIIIIIINTTITITKIIIMIGEINIL